MYGRGIPSIAEQLGKSVQETQVIYNKVLDKFDGLAKFIEESESQARECGYVTTIWGTRRQLTDMQLPYYEFKYKNGVVPDFDPLDMDCDVDEYNPEVPDEIVSDLTNRLLNCKSFKQRENLKETIRQNGLTIRDNSSLIAQAQRQCVNCVDMETEILTTSGWKRYCDVNVGDEILSYNEETQTITKDHITHVHIYEGEYETYLFKNSSFNAVSTPDHRWVSSTHDTKPKVVTTEKIASVKNNPINPILKIVGNTFEDNVDYTDEQLMLISYLMTDGLLSVKNCKYRAQLFQSCKRDKNKKIYNNMLHVLNKCGIKYNDRERSNFCHEITINHCDFLDHLVKIFPNGILTFDFISSLSQRQARLMIDCFIDCDGHRDKRNPDSTSHVYFGTLEKADVFQYLCVIGGCATNRKIIDNIGHKCYGDVSNKCGYVVIKNVYYVVSVLKRCRAHIYKKHISKIVSNGVWCVTTGNDSFIARRDGCVFITKNSRIQGSAANLTKLAQIELYNNQELKDLGFRMLIPVHDEIIAECPIENVKRCSELMSYCMVHAGKDLCVPLKCDVALFYKWYGEEIDPDSL